MINTSDAYKAAVTGDVRRTRVRVPLRVAAPGLTITSGTMGNQSGYSRTAEALDGVLTLSDRYASLEQDRWTLDGSFTLVGNDYGHTGEVGLISEAISGADGSVRFTAAWNLSGADILQAVTVYFPGGELDGYGVDMDLTIKASGSSSKTVSYRDNDRETVQLTGFTVYNPTEITLTVLKWSMPNRHVRIAEIVAGYAADWTEAEIAGLTVTQRASFSAVSLPYGTAALTFDNRDRLFDPWNEAGIYQSLEARQPVPIEIGVDTENGTEYIPVGTYYQHERGWTARDSGMTMRWDLVDIVGLLTDVIFPEQDTLPTTLAGWLSALLRALGDAFSDRYTVDPDYAETPLTAARDAVEGQKCGDILRWLCQASGTFPRADAETGNLAVEPNWNQGNEYTLRNLEDIPAASANDNLAAIRFRLADGTEVVISGNTAATANTLTISNPFLTTSAGALAAARNILTAYGGSRLQLTGRGDPSSEIGDVATVELDQGQAVTARIATQSFDFSSGVLRSCRSELLQADGAFLYENRVVITESGTWTAPSGVGTLYIVLVGGGQSGGLGHPGTRPESLFMFNPGVYYGKNGEKGTDGEGGKVWYGTIRINEGQTFTVTVGAGGVPASNYTPVDGEDTTFGDYSSANGHRYTPSYTDIASGSAYGRTGVAAPAGNSGDGGSGGAGGARGWTEYGYTDTSGNVCFEIDCRYGTAGSIGTPGGSGCVVVYYGKEESA